MAKTKYDPDTFPLLAMDYARQGFTDAQIAAKLGISIQTFYDYQKRYPEFLESLKRGKAPVDAEVENALLKRAMGFWGPDNKYYPPEVGAQIFWLKNRRQDKWRDKQEITGKDGAPVIPYQIFTEK